MSRVWVGLVLHLDAGFLVVTGHRQVPLLFLSQRISGLLGKIGSKVWLGRFCWLHDWEAWRCAFKLCWLEMLHLTYVKKTDDGEASPRFRHKAAPGRVIIGGPGYI